MSAVTWRCWLTSSTASSTTDNQTHSRNYTAHTVTCRSVVHRFLSKYDFPGGDDGSKWRACIHDAKLCNGGIVLCRCLSLFAFRPCCNLASKSRRRREIEPRSATALSRLARCVSPWLVERRSATTTTSPAGRTRWVVAVAHPTYSYRYNDGLALNRLQSTSTTSTSIQFTTITAIPSANSTSLFLRRCGKLPKWV